MTTCEALAEFLGDRPRGDVEGDAGDDRGRRGRARARPRRRPAQRVEAPLRAEDRLAPVDRRGDPRRVRRLRRLARARSGSRARWSPTRRCARAQFVAARTATAGTCAASQAGRDYEPRFADIREPLEGDRCPECGGALTFQTAIEVGHIFNFGDKYSSGLERDVPRRGRTEKPLLGGSYGIGPGRVIAAVIEQTPRRARDRRLAEVDRAVRRARRRPARPRGAGRGGGRRRWRRPAPTCSSTTATCGRARSSPTPT